jgi:hypothetical protein
MITLILGAVLFIASGTLMGIADCWDYLKALRGSRHRKEE